MSEFLWWLLTPSTLMTLLLLLAYLVARARAPRIAAGLVFLPLIVLLALALAPIDQVLAMPLEGRVTVPERLPTDVDGIVVLGGSVDWRVGEDRGQLTLDGAGERMLAALALARRYPDAQLVFTGLFEGALATEWRSDDGLGLLFEPAFRGRDVTYLGEARSTYEEALLAVERIRPRTGSTWLLVTSALHMPRALGTFRTIGWNVTPLPVDYRSPAAWRWRFDPRIGARLAELDRVVREWGAYVVYRATGRVIEN
jgi:uncharacterized SAM-binding protein YcdF (DUF218 family)